VTWEYRLSIDAATRALSTDARLQIAGRVDGIEIVERDDAGRAERVGVRTAIGAGAGGRSGSSPLTIVRGEELRAALSRTFGARSIRSTWFTVRRDRDDLLFAGRGFGHGVGLCQAGALARLRSGAKPADVLRYYYPGTFLARGSAVDDRVTDRFNRQPYPPGLLELIPARIADAQNSPDR
jgi:SpoIID/LytB domain protein